MWDFMGFYGDVMGISWDIKGFHEIFLDFMRFYGDFLGISAGFHGESVSTT